MVAGKLGVKTSETTIIWPAALVVVYWYGVGPPGVPEFEDGEATGPCCISGVVDVDVVVDVDAVVDVDVVASAVVVGLVRVCLKTG